MNESTMYPKVVEWSDKDHCYIGSSPGLVDGCCHGDDPQQVFAELCIIVEECVQLFKEDGKPLPQRPSSIRFPAHLGMTPETAQADCTSQPITPSAAHA